MVIDYFFFVVCFLDLPATLKAIATACFFGLPAFSSVLIFADIAFWLDPFFSGIVLDLMVTD
jgi:hypothetical protein